MDTILLHIRRIGWTIAVAVFFSFPVTPVCGQAQPLFDGKTLNGWDFDSNHWRVEDGAIVGGPQIPVYTPFSGFDGSRILRRTPARVNRQMGVAHWQIERLARQNQRRLRERIPAI